MPRGHDHGPAFARAVINEDVPVRPDVEARQHTPQAAIVDRLIIAPGRIRVVDAQHAPVDRPARLDPQPPLVIPFTDPVPDVPQCVPRPPPREADQKLFSTKPNTRLPLRSACPPCAPPQPRSADPPSASADSAAAAPPGTPAARRDSGGKSAGTPAARPAASTAASTRTPPQTDRPRFPPTPSRASNSQCRSTFPGE